MWKPSGRINEQKQAHFNSLDLSPTNNFISHKVQTIHLVCMSQKVGLNLMSSNPISTNPSSKKFSQFHERGQQTLSIPSALHASLYTAPTWPWSVVMNLLMWPSHMWCCYLSSQCCLPTVQGKSDVGDWGLSDALHIPAVFWSFL